MRKILAQILILTLLAGVLCACKPNDSDGASSGTGSTDATASGAGGAEGSYDNATFTTEYGVEVVDFTVPQPTAEAVVDAAAEFGMDPALDDNSLALDKAIKYMIQNPGTVISIPKGVYHFSPTTGFQLQNIKNGVIDGNGSEFIFSTPNYFNITGCDTLKIQNLTVDWDWEKGTRLTSLVKVESVEGDKVVFQFMEVDDASYAVAADWLVLSEYDAETLTPGCENQVWQYNNNIASSKEYLGGNRVSATITQGTGGMAAGQVYLLFHRTYHGCAFGISGKSQNITLKDVTLYSVSGYGIYGGGYSHHILISGLKVGLRPGTEHKTHISTTVDVIHLSDTSGYFILEDSDISYAGDDSLNIHDNVAFLDTINGNTIGVYASVPSTFQSGDVVSFKNAQDLSAYPVSAKILGMTVSEKNVYLTLDKDVSEVPIGSIVYNSSHGSENYIVRNNYIHETNGRVVINSGNGLIENNKFYKTAGTALQLTVDINRGNWMEGYGQKNVMVRGNTFDSCDITNSQPMIFFKARKDGMTFRENNCFENIAIVDNKMINFPGRAIDVVAAQNVTISGNTIQNDKPVPNSTSERGMISITSLKGFTVTNNTWQKSQYMSEKINEIHLQDRKPDLSQLVQENNVLQ